LPVSNKSTITPTGKAKTTINIKVITVKTSTQLMAQTANGGRGEDGGVDGDAQKAGNGQNDGTNVIGGGSSPQCADRPID
jgi:hypothetical protein